MKGCMYVSFRVISIKGKYASQVVISAEDKLCALLNLVLL